MKHGEFVSQTSFYLYSQIQRITITTIIINVHTKSCDISK